MPEEIEIPTEHLSEEIQERAEEKKDKWTLYVALSTALMAVLAAVAGLLAGVLLYPAALQLYHNGITYIFVDFATAACALLVIVGVAGVIAYFSRLAGIIGFVGAYSYGLYLIHQPYVIWLGLRIRDQPMLIFLLIAVITVAVLSLWGAILEKTTNWLVNRIVATATSPA